RSEQTLKTLRCLSNDVDRQTEGSDGQHQKRVVDGLRFTESSKRLHGDGEAEGGQEHRVGQCADDLGPHVSVSGATRTCAARDAGRCQADTKRHDVREHVKGVRHECDGVAHVSCHYLCEEKDHGDYQHKNKATCFTAIATHFCPLRVCFCLIFRVLFRW
uniref:Uncharacterized protein n=1 Tax=Electrophorus electricus TaxID=8005 RepID=A0A4W4FJI6_ELEEL